MSLLTPGSKNILVDVIKYSFFKFFNKGNVIIKLNFTNATGKNDK